MLVHQMQSPRATQGKGIQCEIVREGEEVYMRIGRIDIKSGLEETKIVVFREASSQEFVTQFRGRSHSSGANSL